MFSRTTSRRYWEPEPEQMNILQYEILRNLRQEVYYKKRLDSLPEGCDLRGTKRKPTVEITITQKKDEET